MSNRTNIYKFLYLEDGDKWYPGYDYENMVTVENQLQSLYRFVGPGILDGWDVEILSNNRKYQLTLLNGYVADPDSEYGQKLSLLNLDFTVTCLAATTTNITTYGTQIIDGIQLAVNDKVLVKNQSTAASNGIYVVQNTDWTRDTSLNSTSDYTSNFIVYVKSGNTNNQTLWIGAVTTLGFVLGPSALYFDNAFKQCVVVTPGNGIVKTYAAKTLNPNYFRYTSQNTYYVWAEPSLCLVDDGICAITSPLPPDEEYDTVSDAVYLGTVTTTPDATYPDFIIVSEITYEDRRNDLTNLTGAFQEALRKAFYNHKHLGTTGNPSKILLSTTLILNGSNNDGTTNYPSSTIFILKNQDGTNFTGNFSNYGIPEVRLDNSVLPTSSYRIDSSSTPKKIYLKNSIDSNSLLQVFLPLSPQKSLLFINSDGELLSGNIATNTNIYLSDGTQINVTLTDGTVVQRYKRFSWSLSKYLPPLVYLNDTIIDAKNYFVDAQGYFYFRTSYFSITSYQYSSLKFIIEAIGREIQNKLSGRQIENINAASFNRGKIDPKRIKNLDHIGDFRYKDTLSIVPSKLLISQGNLSTYYPDTNLDYQFDTTTYRIFSSVNFSNILIGTKRGLFTTSNFSNINLNSNWTNDKGRPKYFADNILIPSGENYFKTTYLLTKEGRVYYTKNSGSNWLLLKSPTGNSGTALNINSFHISTDKAETTSSTGIIKYGYSTYQFAGTSQGLFMAEVADKAAQNDWSWSKITNVFDESDASISTNLSINDVVEISAKKVEVVDNEPDRTSYTRYVYASSSGSESGLYFGVSGSKRLKRVFTDNVKGFYWIKNGADNVNQNDLIWWTDYEAFITHSAIYTEDETGSSWAFPLSSSPSNLCSNVNAASTTNLSATYNNVAGTLTNNSTQAALTIDGVTLSAGNTVLIKNQTSAVQNGIYTVTTVGSGSTNWVLTRTGSVTFTALSGGKIVTVTSGTINSSSIWYLVSKSSYVLGTTNIDFKIYKFKIYATTTPSYTSTRSIIQTVTQKFAGSLTNDVTNYQYLIGHTDGLAVVTDCLTAGEVPTSKNLFWEAEYQGAINHLYSVSNNTNGLIYAATDRGIYVSSDFLWADLNVNTTSSYNKYPWTRTFTLFYDTDEISIYKTNNLEEVTDFTANYQYQLIEFTSGKHIGSQFYYERIYTDFYTDPWNNTNATIIVYINDVPSSIPYTTNPDTGLVRFVSSLKKKDINNVKISISRFEAFISNIGINPHAESYNNLVKSKDPIAYLIKANTASSKVLTLNQTIDSTLTTLILDDGTNVERVTVSKIKNSPLPVEVTLAYTRGSVGSLNTFEPKTTENTGTAVYAVSDAWSLGIEDKIYKIQSQQTYHMGSVNNVNHIKMDLAAQKATSTLFDVSPPLTSTIDKRGLKNLILTQNVASSGLFDTFNSISADYTGIIPSITDRATNPGAIFGIINPSQTGSDTRIATDKGIWIYNNNRWEQESNLNNSTRIYYIKSTSTTTYQAGSDNGLWEKSSSWVSNATYPQTQYDYLTGSWGSGIFEAYGKSDGFAFVYRLTPTSNFTSDHFNLVDQHNVYGLYKDKFLRLVDDGNGGVKQVEIDSLYLLSDVGIFGVTDGAPSGSLNSLLTGRNMMATTKPSDLNYFYKAFRALPTPPATKTPVPLFILTDAGILKIRNWRWCDPNDSAGLDFIVESRHLTDKTCYSYALRQQTGTPGKSKIFIGTNDGVYRSFDEGTNFEKCERIEGGPVIVYDLAIFSSTYSSITSDVILACTERGMFYSVDDGDTWYRTGNTTNEGYLPVEFSFNAKNSIMFNDGVITGGWLAETFESKPFASKIVKASAYLEKIDLSKNALYSYSVENNTIQGFLYSVNSFGELVSLVSTSSTTYNPADIEYPRFMTFDFNFTIPSSNYKAALVVREVVAAGGISVMAWTKSNLVI